VEETSLSARILAHYLGGEDALPAASRAALEAQGIRVMAAADRASLRKLAGASPAEALIVSSAFLASPARVLPALRQFYGRQGLALIVLTSAGEAGEHSKILTAGADDVLLAPADPALLAARLEAAMRTIEQFTSPSSWPRGILKTPDGDIAVDRRGQRCLVREEGGYREVLLTRKQLAALTALLRADGRPVAWEQFFRKGWRPGKLRRRSRTLVQHILALRRKLGRMGARIKSVPGTGYRLSA
jgi:DNA-binding response OmpR family regulator